jgi:hypothetical protein
MFSARQGHIPLALGPYRWPDSLFLPQHPFFGNGKPHGQNTAVQSLELFISNPGGVNFNRVLCHFK